MKVVRLNPTSGSTLVQDAAAQPHPGQGELVNRVCAAGVTPNELLWYPTLHTKSGETRSGAIPGHEFSGVVEATGEDVSSIESGRVVFGMNNSITLR